MAESLIATTSKNPQLLRSERTPLLVGSHNVDVVADQEQAARGIINGSSDTLPHRHLSMNEDDDNAPLPSRNYKKCISQGFSSGTFRVALGAALFAATNAAATALYRRKGSTVVSLYILRSPIIYLANAFLVFILNKRHYNKGSCSRHETAMDVLLLRTGSREASRLALLRSFLNSIKAVLLSIGFVYLTYADAFVIFKGVAVIGTIVVARNLLGGKERLLPQELLCGIFVVIGILLIAPPTSISAILQRDQETQQQTNITRKENDDGSGSADWVPHQTAGVALVISAGLLSAFSGTLMLLLSSSAGPHKTTPSMLLSYLMVLFFIVNGFLALVLGPIMIDSAAVYNGGDTDTSSSAWEWTKFTWPNDRIDWALIATNCMCTLGAHLATAAGYQTTRAGIVAFLQLTEIPWVYLLDVLALGESTTGMKSVGSTIVFVSAVAVALIRQQQQK
mmetsp:Transcript_45223/g.94863  ORF Transcript_45223/g.94863 Transcript_45223/m.94863 type:complete len:451 (+) Transcript_45223:134-1486(+)|eukprot:CAMPEP_0183702472 /NCGR_PEP_ID=MMETSP0737-20130205/563_1 /TAXON_ID=385413 /ORGANISM="Thalassiosira miniscula, Strain CCMP1093" /LENGTH=450 /DNA_ID=CAMNT_0025929083 /DNA_START=76 /DNA_END=1428 /DNA_ORIENTATION=+